MFSNRRSLVLIALLALALTSCFDEPDVPENMLLVMAEMEYIDAMVRIDDVDSARLRPMPDPQSFLEKLGFRLAEKAISWWMKVDDPSLDWVAARFDLEGCPRGRHDVLIIRAGLPVLKGSFDFPEDLQDGIITLSFYVPFESERCLADPEDRSAWPHLRVGEE